ncbi:MAG TPA: FAD-binding protein [Gemmatimonadaceae bacterium]|jgi:FAD/FMN-containing dehydrogenase
MTTLAISTHPSVEEIAATIRDAASPRRGLRIVGAGTWLDGGPPIEATERLQGGHADVVEYVPGDLTITVGANASLSAIAATTSAHDQWLTLDPFGDPNGTIGATVATGSWGPLSTGFGSPRDHVLGLEVVTGLGAIVRGGGRVVKNVAGFDLVRLFTGSRGALGLITEVTLRLRARPAVDATLGVSIDGSVGGMRAIARVIREWPFTPMAAELLDAGAAAAIGLPKATTLLLRLGGNARAVDAQRRRAAGLGRTVEADTAIWARLRAIENGANGVVRILDQPSAFEERWHDAAQIAGVNGALIGTPTRGWIRCVIADVDLQKISAFRARARSASIVIDRLPSASAWHSVTSEINPSGLDARVKAVFDPAAILNPGVLRVVR